MEGDKFQELVDIMRKLRVECPWDKEQTHDSIKSATLEESYEVIEAIDNKDFQELKGELGDLLLHIVFHSVIGEDAKNFTLNEVIDEIKEKLIRRHPHVFGNVEVKDNNEIMKNWETIKLDEGRKSVLEGVPKNLPELHRAFRLQEKASKVGFDWQNKEDVWKKVIEETNELLAAEKLNDKEKMENEMGDLFFSLINYSRFIGINPENALRRTTNKFVKRFGYIEKKLNETGKKITDSNLEEMDIYWEESKTIL
ncbi:MAG: nucleoside triphosphate pyrophosphohydrolase [Melioribacteraceae bacterium]|nr:nucleoside triphosphate pyrophosphohydrolase [Melioribacteraceae bacterium]MCO6472181.1 nucleoside triphosphate pyrophosphohydrolase [Melioribacteraceae bacterium]MDD3557423.1 nucleoside triphosphate pyrophosphohydrolase [Melioribacteraceae bacterium]